MQLVERMSRIGIESAFEVLLKARALEKQGRSVIHLEIGEPDFPTPAHVIEAGKQALDQGYTKYGPTPGLSELREAIASYISRTRGIPVNPDGVCVVPGGKPIMFFSMIALIEPGDEVIYPNPGFPIYESMINFLGGVAVPMPLLESRGFSLDLDQFRDRLSTKTKMVILNSPHNPTGGIIPAADIREMAEILRDRDVMVLSDEIYSRIG
jgi:aspartate/methionine/tyrosine aminotransferase